MKVNIDYKRKDEVNNDPEAISQRELTADYINYACQLVYKDGLEGGKRRIFARICRKLDECIEQNGEEIELEEAEKDFLKKMFADDKFKPSPATAKFIVILEDEIESL